MRRNLIPVLVLLSILAPLHAEDNSVWKSTGTQEFDRGLGKAIGFRSRGGAVATFYVYDLELSRIPSGTSSRIVRDELERAKAELVEYRTSQDWDVREVSQSVVAFGSGENAKKIILVNYEMEREGHVLVSQLYLMGHQNKFFKIRITYSHANRSACEEEVAMLLSEIADALAE